MVYKENRKFLRFSVTTPICINIGWNCDINTKEIKYLTEYARKNNITIKYLSKTINYKKNTFDSSG